MIPIASFLYNEKPYRLKDIGTTYEIPAIRYDARKGVDKTTLVPVKRDAVLGPAYTIWLSNGIRIDTSNLRVMVETPIESELFKIEDKEPPITRSFEIDGYRNRVAEIKSLKKGDYIVLSNGWAHSYIMRGHENMAVKEVEEIYNSHTKYDGRLFMSFQEANEYARGLLMRRMDVRLEGFGDCWSVSVISKEIIKAVTVDRISYEGDMFQVPVVEVMAREYERVFVCCDIFYVEVKGLLPK